MLAWKSAAAGSPTRAWGRCSSSCRLRSPSTVHPHVRGDGLLPRLAGATPCGSPPRAWGRSTRSKRVAVRHRFTPTCVGTVIAGVPRHCAVPVHPHVRGDGSGIVTDISTLRGSPPRAWGRLYMYPQSAGAGRFTPTCVGTVYRSGWRLAPRSVHPHVRGDGYGVMAMAARHTGSPPRAWGRSVPRRSYRRRRRFTPTCVGTVSGVTASPCDTPVHPHVRGDGAIASATTRADFGSPPRAWGRSYLTIQFRAVNRFTPTCVGTVSMNSNCGRGPTVHPHVRGDGCIIDTLIPRVYGSPPRAWGRSYNTIPIDYGMRFTPTCVGTVGPGHA